MLKEKTLLTVSVKMATLIEETDASIQAGSKNSLYSSE